MNKRFSCALSAQTVSLAVMLPLPPAAFLAREENKEEVRRQIAWLYKEKKRKKRKKKRSERERTARAFRPNSHCILETAGYYEHEMFLPSFLHPSTNFVFLLLRLVSCISARFSVCFLTDTNGLPELRMLDSSEMRPKDCRSSSNVQSLGEAESDCWNSWTWQRASNWISRIIHKS